MHGHIQRKRERKRKPYASQRTRACHQPTVTHHQKRQSTGALKKKEPEARACTRPKRATRRRACVHVCVCACVRVQTREVVERPTHKRPRRESEKKPHTEKTLQTHSAPERVSHA